MLLLDAHKSHLFNWDFMSCMKRNKIEVCCFPPHTTHVMQPLDDVPFANLKRNWYSGLHQFNFRVGGRRISKPEFLTLLTTVFTSSMSPNAIKAGYERTGIYPLNRTAKKIEHLQLLSHVTDELSEYFSSDTCH